MTWTWRYQPEDTEAEQPPGAFGSQSDAESWLGESWRKLAESGVIAVVLLHDGEPAGRPVPLAE